MNIHRIFNKSLLHGKRETDPCLTNKEKIISWCYKDKLIGVKLGPPCCAHSRSWHTLRCPLCPVSSLWKRQHYTLLDVIHMVQFKYAQLQSVTQGETREIVGQFWLDYLCILSISFSKPCFKYVRTKDFGRLTQKKYFEPFIAENNYSTSYR